MTSKDHFNQQATHYDQQWNSWSEESLRWMLDHSAAGPADRVLDAGTGAGFTALAFATRAAHVTGVDVSEGMLAEATRNAGGRANVDFRVAPAESLPFPDGAFDLVTCRMAAHHFDSVPAFLCESRRVLAPGGRLVIADTTVPDDDPETDAWQNRVEALRDSSHRRNYTPGEWTRMAAGAGFKVDTVDSTTGGVPITLNAWLIKGGCSKEAEMEVRALFASASERIRRLLAIQQLEGGDTAFRWMRVCLAAK